MELCFYGGFSPMARERGLKEAAKFAAQKGFGSVEFLEKATMAWTPLSKDLDEAKRNKKLLKEYGLTTACYSLETLLWGDGKEDAEKALMKNAELAAELGSPFLHHTLLIWFDKLPEGAPDYEEALEKTVESAARVAKYCQTLGVTCLYEEQGLYFNGVNGFGRFYKEMKNRVSNVGVCGDLGNILFVDERPDPFFDEFKKEICHVHLKDYYQKDSLTEADKTVFWYGTKGGKFLADAPLGKGVVDVEKCFTSLKEAGYEGKFSTEFASLDYIDDGIRFAKSVWEK